MKIVFAMSAMLLLSAGAFAAADDSAPIYADMQPFPAKPASAPVSVIGDAGRGTSCTAERAALVQRDKRAIQTVVDQLDQMRANGYPESISLPSQPVGIRIAYRKVGRSYALLINRRPDAADAEMNALFACSTLHVGKPADVQRLDLYTPRTPGEAAAPIYYAPSVGLYLNH
jgi:hypothetical protein